MNHVSFASDREISALASSTGDIWIVDHTNGRVLKQFHYPILGLSTIAISPDGNNVFVGSSEGVFIQPTLGGHSSRSPIDSSPASSLAFSPDGHSIAIGFDGQVEIWDIETELLTQVIENDWWVDDLVFSPDASLLAGFVRDRLIIWQISDVSVWATVMAINPDDFDPLYSVSSNFAISPDWNKSVIQFSSSEGSTLRVVSLLDGKVLQEVVPADFQSPYFSAFTQVDNSIITILGDPGIGERYDLAIWKTEDNSLNKLKIISSRVTSLSVSPNSDLLAVGLSDGQVHLLDGNTGQLIFDFPVKHDLSVSGLRFSDQGQKLVSAAGGENNIVLVWDIPSRVKIAGFDAPENIVNEGYQGQVSLSPDGNSIVLSPFQEDGVIDIEDYYFNTSWYSNITGKTIASLKIQPSPPTSGRAYISAPPYIDPVAISPDGQSVVAYVSAIGRAQDNGYYIWTMNSLTGKKVIDDGLESGDFYTPSLDDPRIRGNPEMILFSRDGSLMGVSRGMHINIWQVGTWEMVSEFIIPPFSEEAYPTLVPFKISGQTTTPAPFFPPAIPYMDGILTMQFSSDGELLATAGENGIVRIWRVSDGELLAAVPPVNLRGDEIQNQLSQHYSSILALTFSADNTRLYAGDDFGVLHVYAIKP
ncbi:MAG: WD40 repeat-containing protein [Chloroflexi bacterium]|nr:MAG: WD40 repeat-containing protein [Chloroflexota bacterium]